MLLRALDEAVDELHLAMFDPALPAQAPYGRSFTPLPMPRVRAEPSHEYQLRNLLDPRPYAIRTRDSRGPRQVVSSLEPDEFDAIVAYRIDFAHYAGVAAHPRLVLDIDDPEHLRQRERVRALNWTDLCNRWDVGRLRRFERNIARRAASALVCQENDRVAFDPPPLVVPNCVTVPAECPPRDVRTPSVLFVGAVDGTQGSPNVDAVLWFLDQVWPRILGQAPTAEFLIAGTAGGTVREAAGRLRNVRLLGYVADLHAMLRQSSLSVAPIRFGTGTRLKILESMAWGCPVVSTPKGCEGLVVEHGRDLFIGNSPEEFAGWCCLLLNDREAQRTMAVAAHALVSRSYDVARRHSWLVDLLRNLVQAASRR